ncbi:MAG: L-2-amino-thiazoline-4-carboxylic acid hydrolase [Synergistaceae bacterium]|jgi:hypothetical protein|nr:L-2-amino-thiazoline-4-carboxylic acid hydrolase [Synergistaceae bacterium]
MRPEAEMPGAVTPLKALCSDEAQDRWSHLYRQIAESLEESFGMRGRAVLREGVRQYAALLGREKRAFLEKCGLKTSLKTAANLRGPFPVGVRTDKEWIEHTEQQLFVNIVRCPHAELWNQREKRHLGQLWCEEFYPAYFHSAIGDAVQINMTRVLTNPGDEHCRFSVYLRPANLDLPDRKRCFDGYDPDRKPVLEVPEPEIDFEQRRRLLFSCIKDELRRSLDKTLEDIVNVDL